MNMCATAVILATNVPCPPRRPRDAALIYAENRLFPWAQWAKEHRDALGYATVSLLYKAMQMTKVGVIRGSAYPRARPGPDGTLEIDYPINADGHETRSMRPLGVGEVSDAIAEVDGVVAALPRDLHEVIIADFFTYGCIEVRCKQTRFKRARYSQLLESAKYAVYAALHRRNES